MKNISVITAVFNEETRIENLIKCFSWSDDLIIVDKSSTDKTEEIIKKYISPTIHFENIPYTESPVPIHEIINNKAKNDWVMLITASGLIDPGLVDIIHDTIYSNNFNYSEVWVPYKMYAFGIYSKHSPWFSEYKPLVFKKDSLIIQDKVHEEIRTNGKKYTITDNSHGYYYHLTHRNLDIFYERHIRYAYLEANKYNDPISAKKITFNHIKNSIKNLFMIRKCFKLGWDGIALALGYISYRIMVYLSIWQKFNKKGEKTYLNITNDVLKKWEK